LSLVVLVVVKVVVAVVAQAVCVAQSRRLVVVAV
jgi:hypothetical protein